MDTRVYSQHTPTINKTATTLRTAACVAYEQDGVWYSSRAAIRQILKEIGLASASIKSSYQVLYKRGVFFPAHSGLLQWADDPRPYRGVPQPRQHEEPEETTLIRIRTKMHRQLKALALAHGRPMRHILESLVEQAYHQLPAQEECRA